MTFNERDPILFKLILNVPEDHTILCSPELIGSTKFSGRHHDLYQPLAHALRGRENTISIRTTAASKYRKKHYTAEKFIKDLELEQNECMLIFNTQ